MTHPRFNHRHLASHRGIALLDVMIGLAITALMLVMISQLLSQHQASERAMAQRRAAMRQAEWVLTSLQLGKAFPNDVPCEVAWLRDQAAANGRAWVRVRVVGEAGKEVSLVGQVPIASLGDDLPAELRAADTKRDGELGNNDRKDVTEIIVRSTLTGGAK